MKDLTIRETFSREEPEEETGEEPEGPGDEPEEEPEGPEEDHDLVETGGVMQYNLRQQHSRILRHGNIPRQKEFSDLNRIYNEKPL